MHDSDALTPTADPSELFTRYYADHYDAVLAHARTMTDHHHAHDLTNEAFMRLWRQLKSGKGQLENPCAYLKTTARHLLVDEIRRTHRQLLVDDSDIERDDATTSAVDPTDQLIERQHVRAVLDGMLPRWSSILTLTFVDGLPTSEAASKLDLTANAGAALAMRARKAFAAAYQRHNAVPV